MKEYIETIMHKELPVLQELIEVIREGRLLIEKLIERNQNVELIYVKSVLDELEEKYTKVLLFLKKMPEDIQNNASIVFMHELKNKIRNTIEKLQDKEWANDGVKKNEHLSTLTDIRNDEVILIEKFSKLHKILIDYYKNELKRM